MSALVEPFREAFMQRALLEVVLMGVACGLLGAFVLLRGLAYTGESLSHMLLPGGAIAVVVGVPVLGGALVAGLLGAVALGALLRRPELNEDVAVGVAFSAAFATGVLLLSLRGTPKDLESLLFGGILSVGRGDLAAGATATLVVVVLVAVLAERLVLVAFDPVFARAVGLRPARLDLVLLALLAAALAVALRGVGTLLVLSLLTAPAATARVLTVRAAPMLLLAPALGVGAGVVGLVVSYHADLAAGPAIALAAAVPLAPALAVTSARRRGPSTAVRL